MSDNKSAYPLPTKEDYDKGYISATILFKLSGRGITRLKTKQVNYKYNNSSMFRFSNNGPYSKRELSFTSPCLSVMMSFK